MSSNGWNSESSSDDQSRKENAENPWSMDDVLRRTADSGQADDVLETIKYLQSNNPQAKPSEIDMITRFVLALLKRRYPDLPLKSDKVLTMASTIAQSLVEDPVASERMRLLWSQLS
ncbi:hypothetical protein [Bremerella sp. P1]|uniref:hypothetical protein n=1 Tax=Bremerella sp. P1 TaxID=3026424 RepID=UPI002368B75F|nr:hypothetical protein [Bremerella sp. P1]WDI43652.1 hypothetical protein PSR63_06795 [Bremerella sp. P1]